MARRPRVLMILEAGDFYPSGILRGLIHLPALRRDGFDVTVRNRTSPRVLWLRQRIADRIGRLTGWTPRLRIVDAALLIAARLREPLLAIESRRHDLVYTSKLLSYRLLTRLRRPIVYDFGDAVWLDPGVKRFNDMLAFVDEVTTDNEITASHVRRFNPRCTMIPDPCQVETFDRRRGHVRAEDGKVLIGWIGTPKSAENLELIRPVLERIGERYPHVQLRLLGIGADFAPFARIPTIARRTYDETTMVDEVLRMDIGLFPLFDNESSVTRGVTKAAIYMAGGTAVVASPVGLNATFIEDGVTGMLAEGDWEEKLARLIEDAPLRRRIAAAALEKVRRELSLESSVAALERVFRRHLGGSPAG
jgi:glycosyltransferase involved in cell wall biosynthesis